LELIGKLSRAKKASLAETTGFSAAALTGAAAGLAVLLSGLIFTGYFNSFSDVPLGSYLLVLAAPVILWLAPLGPLKDLSGPKAFAVQTATVVAVLGASLGWALAVEGI
jgi:hypothetical protein